MNPTSHHFGESRPLPAFVLLAAVSVLLGGCARHRRPGPHAEMLNVPHHAQEMRTDCGLRTVDMFTDYWNCPLPVAARSTLVAEVEPDGVRASTVVNALREGGYEAYLLRGTWEPGPTGIQHHLERGRPMLVQIRQDPRHWVLVVGRDPERDEIILADPVRGRVAVGRDRFASEWQQAHNLLIVASPPAGSPPPAPAVIE